MAWLLVSPCQPENMYTLLGLVGWNAAQALASFLATDPKNQNFVFNAAQNMGLDVVPLISNDEVIGYQFANPELGNTGQVLLAGYTTGAGNVKIANILGATDAGIEIESNEQKNESIEKGHAQWNSM